MVRSVQSTTDTTVSSTVAPGMTPFRSVMTTSTIASDGENRRTAATRRPPNVRSVVNMVSAPMIR